jgi:alpha-L-fucosidase
MITNNSRRDFIKKSVLTSSMLGLGLELSAFKPNKEPQLPITKQSDKDQVSVQRLSLSKLKRWEALEYGMFIHFGMSTFSGAELGSGKDPCQLYQPKDLDVDQWIKVARDAGMKYAVLTTKHVSGHCLWPSKFTNYHIGNSSGNSTDVVNAFVNACSKYGIIPGFYYCSWDNHHLFGSATPTNVAWENKFSTSEYFQFQQNQIHELLTQYGPIGEVWIDIPGILSHENRQKQYAQIAELQPDALVMMNGGLDKKMEIDPNYSWPTDLVSLERSLPPSRTGYHPMYTMENYLGKKSRYYIPGEVCDTICYTWFWQKESRLRNVDELLGMRILSKVRSTNLLLNVPPDQSGKIPQATIDLLKQLNNKYRKVME